MQFANGQVVTQVGDKLTSAHGQKGVVGAWWPAADMPYMEDGTPMDAFMNPHAFPPRMFGSGDLQMGRAAQARSAGSLALGTDVIACVCVAGGEDASVGLGL
jgi:DNA-directed RNA polymerase III subunit RPC2